MHIRLLDKLTRIVLAIFVRGVVGWSAGLIAGLLSGIVVGLLIALTKSDNAAAITALAVFGGGGIGSAVVGVVVAWLENVSGHKSHAGLGWGIVGAISACLVSWLVHLPFAFSIVWIAMYAGSAIAAYRSVSALFDDGQTEYRLTPRSITIYCLGVLVTSGVIYAAFEIVGSMMD